MQSPAIARMDKEKGKKRSLISSIKTTPPVPAVREAEGEGEGQCSYCVAAKEAAAEEAGERLQQCPAR